MPKENAIHTVYRLADGTRVPSVTTYLGILNKPAIVHWAWELGTQGLDYRKVRDQSGDIGTNVHSLILCCLKGEKIAEVAGAEAEPMSKYFKWAKGKRIDPIIAELPLVSETYRFGGTPDFYGTVNGKLTLLDFKTSGAIYPENFYQLAAYQALLIDNGHPAPKEIAILRVGKDANEGFEYRQMGDLEPAWEIFLACQKIYELQKIARRGR